MSLDRLTTAAGSTCPSASPARRVGTSPLLVPAATPSVQVPSPQPHLLGPRPGLVREAKKAKNKEATKRKPISGQKELLAEDGKLERKSLSPRRQSNAKKTWNRILSTAVGVGGVGGAGSLRA